MSAAALVSVEDYLRMSEKPNREYREGTIYPKAMPTRLHSIIQLALCKLLGQQGWEALPELTVRLTPSKYLVPDVTVIQDVEDVYPTKPVPLCCEILSPEDRLGTMLAKCEEYHAWGVPFCWVIDPVKRSAWEYHSGAEPVRAVDTLRAGEIVIRLDELFSALDQPR